MCQNIRPLHISPDGPDIASTATASKIFKLTKLKTVRRMFPTLRVSFRNVPEGGRYLVLLDIVPCDNKRYR